MHLKTHYPTSAADGHRRFVSVSEVAGLDCWRKYRWQRAGLQPVRRFEALNYGIAWDAFVTYWWGPYSRPDDLIGSTPVTVEMRLEVALREGHLAIDKEARRVDAVLLERGTPRPQDWADELERAHALMDAMGSHYAEHYGPESDWTRVAGQVRFEVPFPSASGQRRSSRYWLHGVIDRVMLHKPTGKLSIWDDKTAAKIGPDFYDAFEFDLQLQVYAWAMRELGNDIDSAWVDAAAKLIPVKPEMRQTPFPVYARNGIGEIIMERDAESGEMKPVQMLEPVPCDKCDGPDPACKTCRGTGNAHFVSGARAGEAKTKKVTRAGLATLVDSAGGMNYLTTYDLLMDAIDENGLDPDDYRDERALLMGWKDHDRANPYFGRADLLVTDAMMDEAAQILRDAAPYLDKLPDVAMRNRFRCARCPFRAPCIERNADARAEILANEYTTREQRKAQAQRVEAEAAMYREREAVTANPF